MHDLEPKGIAITIDDVHFKACAVLQCKRPLFLIITVSLICDGEMAKAQFELYMDNAGKYRFRLRAPNNEIIAVSEAYKSKDGALNGINSVRKNAPEAILQDLTKK